MIYANNEHIFLCYSVIIATIYPDFTIPFRYPCLTTVLFSRSLESCHRSYVNNTPKCHEHFRGPRRRSLSKIIIFFMLANTASGEGDRQFFLTKIRATPYKNIKKSLIIYLTTIETMFRGNQYSCRDEGRNKINNLNNLIQQLIPLAVLASGEGLLFKRQLLTI